MNFFKSKADINEGVKRFRDSRNALLVDVRSEDEYRDGHIRGSVNIPLDKLREVKLSKNNYLFVYCHSGMRSSRAVKWFNDNGYRAESIGGIVDYKGHIE